MEPQKSPITKSTLSMKINVEAMCIPDFKCYQSDTVIKSAW